MEIVVGKLSISQAYHYQFTYNRVEISESRYKTTTQIIFLSNNVPTYLKS